MMKKTWWVLAAALMLCAVACDDQRYSSGVEVQQEDQNDSDQNNGDEQDLDDNNREEDDDEDLDDVDDEDLNDDEDLDDFDEEQDDEDLNDEDIFDEDFNDDEELPPNACRTHEDCSEDVGGCLGVDMPLCGMAPMEGCVDDGDCFEGTLCMGAPDRCSHQRFTTFCLPPCQDDAQCGDGLFCNGEGRCQVALCTEPEGACPKYMECDPERISPGDPQSGCFYVNCLEDGDCNEQEFCVNRICQAGLGFCGDPPP